MDQQKVKQIIVNYTNLHRDISHKPITKDDVYVVCFVKHYKILKHF